MGLTIFWLQLAEDKLNDIYSYCKSKAGKTTALKIVNGIVDMTIDLNRNPFIGQKEDSLSGRKQEFRYLLFSHYKIIYWVNNESERIEIANVFDTRQNPIKIQDTE
jgi:plasmid stabilization system protein ParE